VQLGAIRKWLEGRALPFPIAIDDGLVAFRAYGVVAVPTTIVIDPKGKIVMRLAGFPVGGAERLIKLVEHRLVEEGKASKRPPIEAVSLGHRRAVRYLRLARVLVGKGENEMAEYTLKKAIEQDAELIEARVELASLYEAMEKPKAVDAVLAQAARKFPGNSSLLLARARAMFRRGSHTTAAKLAQKALTQNPSLAPALTLLGRVHLARNDKDKALAAFAEAAKRNPLDPEPIVQAARVLELQGDKARALERYERAYELLQVK
jgi:tetratricopeptide (TPR) repeat protein